MGKAVATLYFAGLVLFGETGLSADATHRWMQASGGLSWHWTTTGIEVKGTAKARKLLSFDSVAGGKYEPGCKTETQLSLLSLVGPILSYELKRMETCGDKKAPIINEQVKWGALNGREGRAARLTDFFPERSLLNALLAQPIIKRSLEKSGTEGTPRDLAGLIKAIDTIGIIYDAGNAECFASLEKVLGSFAFESWDGRKASVRLSVEMDGTRVCAEKPVTIALNVSPMPRATEWFKQAKPSKRGFLLNSPKAPNPEIISAKDTPCGTEPSRFCLID